MELRKGVKTLLWFEFFCSENKKKRDYFFEYGKREIVSVHV